MQDKTGRIRTNSPVDPEKYINDRGGKMILVRAGRKKD